MRLMMKARIVRLVKRTMNRSDRMRPPKIPELIVKSRRPNIARTALALNQGRGLLKRTRQEFVDFY
jgi:hypothetical protein